MSNLLLASEKRLALHEYRLRTAIAFLFLLGALTTVGVVALVPSFVRIRSLVFSAENTRSFEAETLEQLGISEVARGFREANEELSVLASTLARPDFASLMRILTTARPGGVSIQSILYEPRSGESALLTLGGTALLRDDLLQFIEALRRERAFAAVDLPIDTLAHAHDIRFTDLLVTLAAAGQGQSGERLK